MDGCGLVAHNCQKVFILFKSIYYIKMASRNKYQTAFQAMRKRAVKNISKPARILMGKIRKSTKNESPADKPNAEIYQPAQQDVCCEIVPYRQTNDLEGLCILSSIEKGKLAITDKYLRQVELCGKYKNHTLIWTDKRFVVVSDSRKIEWQKEWSKIHSSPFIVYCCHSDEPYDKLVIPYKESKVVTDIGWDSFTSRFNFNIKTKKEKVFDISKYEVIADEYFDNNNLIRFSYHHK